MYILQALKEIADHHDAHVKMMTPWGKKMELLDVVIEEAKSEGHGLPDPNDYVCQADGIHYITGEMAYEISKE